LLFNCKGSNREGEGEGVILRAGDGSIFRILAQYLTVLGPELRLLLSETQANRIGLTSYLEYSGGTFPSVMLSPSARRPFVLSLS
jgi:hypothetical protein